MRIIQNILAKIGFTKAHLAVVTDDPINSYAAEAWVLFGSPLHRKHLKNACRVYVNIGDRAQHQAQSIVKTAISRSTISIVKAGGLTFNDVRGDTPYQEPLSNLFLHECGYIVARALKKAQKESIEQ